MSVHYEPFANTDAISAALDRYWNAALLELIPENPDEPRREEAVVATTQRDHLKDLYRSWAERMAAEPPMELDVLRDMFEEWHLPTVEPTVFHRAGS